MKLTLHIIPIALALTAVVASADSLKLKDLPPSVQKTIQETIKGGEIKTIEKETEHGVTQFEVETILNGKHRDINVDTQGRLLAVEEEVDIASIPAAARTAIEKRMAGKTLRKVESVTNGDGVTLYEAAYTTKAGKKGSVLVKADGTESKN